jgi:hypothetical protein
MVKIELGLQNPTIMAVAIAINVRSAYHIHMVLGGWVWDTPRSWWIAQSTDIGGVTGHFVLIGTW